jgi:hypothetical protein
MIMPHYLKVAVLGVLICVPACKTTSPSATGPKSLIDPTESGTGKSTILPAAASIAPADAGFTPVLLEWVVVKTLARESDDGSFTWDIYLRSSMEIFCELDCSEFKLGEVTINGITELTALKKTIHGNSNPGILNIHKEIPGSKVLGNRIKINNVGLMGQSILLKDAFTKDNPNFYAVPMLISKLVDAPQGVLLGEFSGKKIEIRLDRETTKSPPKLGLEPESAFVIGSLFSDGGGERPTSEEFRSSKILFPWTGN